MTGQQRQVMTLRVMPYARKEEAGAR